jgi:hypothetical protein
MEKQLPGITKDPRFFWQVDTEHWKYDKVSPKLGEQLAVELQRRTGRPAVHYAPKWAYGNSVPNPKRLLWASNYSGSGSPAGWLTQWNRTKKLNHPGWAPYSGRVPFFLQYSSDAVIGGQRTCDANAVKGSEANFLKRMGMK